jgi:hypothetical protein
LPPRCGNLKTSFLVELQRVPDIQYGDIVSEHHVIIGNSSIGRAAIGYEEQQYEHFRVLKQQRASHGSTAVSNL